MNLLEYPTLLAIVGGLGLAWESTKKSHKNPLLLLGSGLLVVLVAAQHLFAGHEGFWSIPAALKDLGLGALAGAALYAFRSGKSSVFAKIGASMAGLAALGYGWGAFSGAFHTQEILTELGPDDRLEEIQSVLSRYHATAERAFPSVSIHMDENLAQYYIIRTEARFANALTHALQQDRENVDSAELNAEVSLDPEDSAPAGTPNGGLQSNDPKANEQWALQSIFAPEAWTLLQNASPQKKARVAILDTGVEGGHEDLKSVFLNSPGLHDQHGHGTHCAGIAGAATNNGIGMASLNWGGKFVEVAAYHALNGAGYGSNESIAQAMVDAVNDGADVLSLSLGGPSTRPPKVLKDAVAYARKRNVVVIVAAGNANESGKKHSPANIDGVITVSASDSQKRKASFSNTNNGLKQPIAAPGVDILSTKPGNQYMTHSGTSMATPLVAGLAGVLRALRPDLKPDEVYEILKRTGQSNADESRIGRIINAEAAIRVVQ